MVYRNGQWYANGLNSFRYNNNPNTLYSPYYGQNFLNLFQWIKDNGGTDRHCTSAGLDRVLSYSEDPSFDIVLDENNRNSV